MGDEFGKDKGNKIGGSRNGEAIKMKTLCLEDQSKRIKSTDSDNEMTMFVEMMVKKNKKKKDNV